MDRRQFLGRLAMGCSLAASPLVTPIALASAPWDERLVVIVLRGAMDGLDAVRPGFDPAYAGLRPTLAAGGPDAGGPDAGGPDAGGLDAGGGWLLHPALEPLMPLWAQGEAGAVHAVSTPYRDRRSHFDGQDILEAGSGPANLMGVRDGWLNRMLAAVPGVESETAYAIGRENMQILTGQVPVTRWSPDARLRLSPQARRLLEGVFHADPLFRDAAGQAVAIVDGLAADGVEAGRADHVHLARFAAGRLRGDTRIASFSLGGWDTHRGQRGALGQALGRLSETILTLRDGLGPVWERTAVLCLTEFGRTARENGTGGTDHGTGGAMIFAGGALRGGRVLGDWPGLGEGDLYGGRDLTPTRDVRAHAAWALRGLFGLDRAALEGAVFPGLDLGGDPGLLA